MRSSLLKLIPIGSLAQWRAGLSPDSFPLVATNGCFDLLHPGHVQFLEAARALGKSLLVGVTGDASVRALKGAGRPVISAHNRIRLLAGLESVSAVCLFEEIDAVRFLSIAQPQIYVKGGDYTIDSINRNEREFLTQSQVRIQFLPLFGDTSTTQMLRNIQSGFQ